MKTLQLCLSICLVILFCSRCDTTITKTLRSGKSTIGPVFVTVTKNPNQVALGRVLIKFSGPPDTLVYVAGQKRTKVQVSDGEFVSEVQLESLSVRCKIGLYSKTTFDKLRFTVESPGYFEIYPSCNIDITSTDVGEQTTYTIEVTECQEDTLGGVGRAVLKNGEIVPWEEYLTVNVNEYVSLVENATTVSFSRSEMMKEDAEFKFLYFDLMVLPDEENDRPWYLWSYSLI